MKELTLEALHRAVMRTGKSIEKIKATSEFCSYIEATCLTTFVATDTLPPGVIGKFAGIPIEIDNTIGDECYEFVLKENAYD